MTKVNKLNIGIGKFAKSLVFNPLKYNSLGGDHDVNYFISLAQMFPEVNFYILSKSDYARLDPEWRSKFIPKNMINCWDIRFDVPVFEQLTEYFKRNDIVLDYSLILSGPTSNSSIPNYSLGIKDPTKYNTPIEMGINYVAPLVYLFNTNKWSYAEIGEDPRYIPSNGQDIIQKASRFLSTRDLSKDSEENKKYHTVKSILEPYTAERKYFNFDLENWQVDKFFLMQEDYSKNCKEPGVRTNKISVYSNGNSGRGVNKYNIMKEYFIDNLDKSEWTCYGKWEEDVDPDNFIDEPMIKLVPQMLNTRYTFMMAVQNGWPSSKLYKMLTFGMIPFIHKDWDSDRNVDTPDFIRVSSALDMKSKMEQLDSNPELYRKIWDECQSILKPEYYSGDKFADDFIRLLKEEIGDLTRFDLRRSEIKTRISCIFPITIEKSKNKQLF